MLFLRFSLLDKPAVPPAVSSGRIVSAIVSGSCDLDTVRNGRLIVSVMVDRGKIVSP